MYASKVFQQAVLSSIRGISGGVSTAAVAVRNAMQGNERNAIQEKAGQG